jgi:hypothetical protein
MTGAEFAAMDFEPWQGEVDTKKLPNNEQFAEDGLFHLITCRMALVMMYKTKAELSELFEQDGDAMCELVEGMGRAKNFFSHFSGLLDAASARLFAGGGQRLPKHTGEMRPAWAGNGAAHDAAPSLSHLEASRAVLGLAAAARDRSGARDGGRSRNLLY